MKKPANLPLRDLPIEQRWKEQLYPAPIVVALIRRKSSPAPDAVSSSHYLLIKRNGDPYKNCWALVGGKWDFGEALPEAILREVKEETSLDASFVAVRGIVSERLSPVSDEETGAHFLLFVCELQANSGDAKEQHEGELAWFTKEEIEQLHQSRAIIPSDYAMFSKFARSNRKVEHIEAEMIASTSGESAEPLQLLSFEQIE